MRKISLLSGLLISLATVLAIGGCATGAPDKAPDVVVKDGMAKLADVTSFTYEVSLKGDMKDEASGDVKFDINMAGALDVKDTKDPKLSLKLDGSMDAGPDATGTFDAEMMLDKAAMYAKVTKLDLEGMEDMPTEVTEMFGKWYMMALPEGALDEFTSSLPGEAEGEMTPEQKEMKAAFEESKVFGDPKFEGTENVMGDNSYKYAVTVNNDGLADFLQKVAKIQGETMSASEVADLKEGLENMKINGYVWVSVKSGIMNKFEGTIAVDVAGETSGTIAISSAMGKINEPVKLSIPTDAEEFPTELLFGAMMMGATADPAMMNADDSMMGDYDYSDLEGMEDFDMSDFEDLEGMEDFDPAMLDI